ncbi:propionyl-CoA synthetase [Aestuariirhabdus sp. Z084]|uniref:propionyl-CoA synthetase n=1 Tax=Aestuariirhabdus haliotis TaxID=2918751 RepID=UPI00201B36A8|nr:propionyl-CoA synthetase [Aestuariirhabdus haliotis]MCL6414663.1 propionyl-CoA synthetase [Aestuariirhabdus haliotis]MCL6418355.1 propionyl-CoA synthetase [Aestuariirhabdus haliotis]
MSYHEEYAYSIENPEGFWKEKAEGINWFKSPQNILSQDDNGIDRWFADGELNTAYLALDYHVENGRGEQTALIYDSPVTGKKRQYSYNQLLDEVSRTAGMLAELGVGHGDRVVIYMPMIPEAAMAMLACARLGAVHSVVFGGFAPNELAVRIDDAEPKVVLSASCGIEVNRIIEYKPMLDEALAIARHKPVASVVFQREQGPATMNEGIDHDWNSLLQQAKPVGCTPVNALDPLYVLYTSGTTGKPKGVVRDNGGHAVAMHYSMKAIYNMDAGDVFWAASDVGWVVGHSYIVYAPLIRGCTTIFYEGKPVFTPDAGAFWRVASEYKVRALFAAPTAFRAIKKEDPDGALIDQYDLSALETIFMAGERLDPPTYDWTVEKTSKPVIDHWWQTETGWAIASNLAGVELLPVKPGSATVPVPGFNVQILNESGEPAAANEQGFVAIKQPMPPSCLPTVWGDINRFRSGYLEQFPGYYVSGDGGYLDDDGYLFIMGRVDDVINVAGHRLSTGEMEEVVAGHPAVAECAVIGINDELKGQLPLGLILLKNGVDLDPEQLEQELVQMVRDEIGPLACFRKALVVSRLPKTRSGKILRRSLRQIAAGEEYAVPSTIDDPASLPEIEDLMAQAGVISAPA